MMPYDDEDCFHDENKGPQHSTPIKTWRYIADGRSTLNHHWPQGPEEWPCQHRIADSLINLSTISAIEGSFSAATHVEQTRPPDCECQRSIERNSKTHSPDKLSGGNHQHRKAEFSRGGQIYFIEDSIEDHTLHPTHSSSNTCIEFEHDRKVKYKESDQPSILHATKFMDGRDSDVSSRSNKAAHNKVSLKSILKGKTRDSNMDHSDSSDASKEQDFEYIPWPGNKHLSEPLDCVTNLNLCNHSNGPAITFTSGDGKKNPAAMIEKGVITKQRQEIHLLMEELATRDRELNDLVKSHQSQFKAWENDRARLNHLQARLAKYEEELQQSDARLKETLVEMTRVCEQKDIEADELDRTKSEMQKLMEKVKKNSVYIEEMEDQNKKMDASVKELMSRKRKMDERERELLNMIKKKDEVISTKQLQATTVKEELKALSALMESCQEKHSNMSTELAAWKNKYCVARDEADKLAAELKVKDKTVGKITQQLHESLQQAIALQKALFTSCEREKCKEDLLISLRKQQKRTMQELSNLREIYDRQNQDLTLYHLSVQERETEGSLRPASGQEKKKQNMNMSQNDLSREGHCDSFLVKEERKSRKGKHSLGNQSKDEEGQEIKGQQQQQQQQQQQRENTVEEGTSTTELMGACSTTDRDSQQAQSVTSSTWRNPRVLSPSKSCCLKGQSRNASLNNVTNVRHGVANNVNKSSRSQSTPADPSSQATKGTMADASRVKKSSEKSRMKESKAHNETSGVFDSSSDVSQWSPVLHLDGDLTPADSDGMCHELKRAVPHLHLNKPGQASHTGKEEDDPASVPLPASINPEFLRSLHRQEPPPSSGADDEASPPPSPQQIVWKKPDRSRSRSPNKQTVSAVSSANSRSPVKNRSLVSSPSLQTRRKAPHVCKKDPEKFSQKEIGNGDGVQLQREQEKEENCSGSHCKERKPTTDNSNVDDPSKRTVVNSSDASQRKFSSSSSDMYHSCYNSCPEKQQVTSTSLDSTHPKPCPKCHCFKRKEKQTLKSKQKEIELSCLTPKRDSNVVKTELSSVPRSSKKDGHKHSHECSKCCNNISVIPNDTKLHETDGSFQRADCSINNNRSSNRSLESLENLPCKDLQSAQGRDESSKLFEDSSGGTSNSVERQPSFRCRSAGVLESMSKSEEISYNIDSKCVNVDDQSSGWDDSDSQESTCSFLKSMDRKRQADSEPSVRKACNEELKHSAAPFNGVTECETSAENPLIAKRSYYYHEASSFSEDTDKDPAIRGATDTKASPLVESSSSSRQPFTSIRAPSLYKQLSKIHFCEKTRRYEWSTPPSQADSGHGMVDRSGNSSCCSNNNNNSNNSNNNSNNNSISSHPVVNNANREDNILMDAHKDVHPETSSNSFNHNNNNNIDKYDTTQRTTITTQHHSPFKVEVATESDSGLHNESQEQSLFKNVQTLKHYPGVSIDDFEMSITYGQAGTVQPSKPHADLISQDDSVVKRLDFSTTLDDTEEVCAPFYNLLSSENAENDFHNFSDHDQSFHSDFVHSLTGIQDKDKIRSNDNKRNAYIVPHRHFTDESLNASFWVHGCETNSNWVMSDDSKFTSISRKGTRPVLGGRDYKTDSEDRNSLVTVEDVHVSLGLDDTLDDLDRRKGHRSTDMFEDLDREKEHRCPNMFEDLNRKKEHGSTETIEDLNRKKEHGSTETIEDLKRKKEHGSTETIEDLNRKKEHRSTNRHNHSSLDWEPVKEPPPPLTEHTNQRCTPPSPHLRKSEELDCNDSLSIGGYEKCVKNLREYFSDISSVASVSDDVEVDGESEKVCTEPDSIQQLLDQSEVVREQTFRLLQETDYVDKDSECVFKINEDKGSSQGNSTMPEHHTNPSSHPKSRTSVYEYRERLRDLYTPRNSEPPREMSRPTWPGELAHESLGEEFDDKLSGFLEDPRHGPDDSILFSVPMSPATKLHRLLRESQEMIRSLEKCSAVPPGLRGKTFPFNPH